MKTTLLSLMVTLSLAGSALAEEGRESGGGDAVRCLTWSGNAFSGTYALDYLATFNKLNGNEDIVPIVSWEESAARVKRFLKAFAPEHEASFNEFLQYQKNYTDNSAPQIWVSGPEGLVDIPDENLIRLIPGNCRQSAGAHYGTFQAVIRVLSPGQIRYEADTDLLKELEARPLQHSFLLIHEWLRFRYKDAAQIRKVNRYLHSREWEREDVTFDKVQSTLALFGFRNENAIEDTYAQRRAEAFAAVLAGDEQKLEEILKGTTAWSVYHALKPLSEVCQQEPAKALPVCRDTHLDPLKFARVSLVDAAILLRHDTMIDLIARLAGPKQFTASVTFALARQDLRLARQLVSKGFPAPDWTAGDYAGIHSRWLLPAIFASDDLELARAVVSEFPLQGVRISALHAATKAGARATLTFLASQFDVNEVIPFWARPYPWGSILGSTSEFASVECGSSCYDKYSIGRGSLLTILLLSSDADAAEFLLGALPGAVSTQITHTVDVKNQTTNCGWCRWNYRDSTISMSLVDIGQKMLQSHGLDGEKRARVQRILKALSRRR